MVYITHTRNGVKDCHSYIRILINYAKCKIIHHWKVYLYYYLIVILVYFSPVSHSTLKTFFFPICKEKIIFWYLYNGKECINLVSLTENCPLHPSFNQCNTIRIGFSMLQKWFIQLNIFNCYWWWNYLITVNSASDITSRNRTLTVECNLLINFIVLLS